MRSFRLAVPLLLAVLSGCVTKDTAMLAEGCLLNTDCVDPLVCVFRRCHTTCSGDRDCPNGSRCQITDNPYAVCLFDDENSCVDKACPPGLVCGPDKRCRRDCITNRECLSEQQCIEGQCVSPLDRDSSGLNPNSGLCRYDSDCTELSVRLDAGFLRCLNNRCAPQCVDATQCATGQVCTRGQCVSPLDSGVQGVACVYNSDCAMGLLCRTGQCVPECINARDCRANQICASGLCRDVVDGGDPVDSGTVDAGLTCQLNSQCPVPLLCRSGQCVPECFNSRDCAADQFCEAQVCKRVDAGVVAVDAGTDAGSTVVDAGAGCQFNSQCTPPLQCRGGQCLPECRATSDCAAGLVCLASRCVPPGGDPDGGPTGWGTACSFQSTCAPFGLVCGPQGVCTYQCLDNADCQTNAGLCCVSHRCIGGNACVVVSDAGTVDAGRPTDGGCRSDNDCLDTDFCNGSEACIAGSCRPGRSPCDDSNPCTLDTCTNANQSCSYQSTATDSDNDQHFPIACGGTADDCDDNDALSFPGALERCDWKDNNCNGAVDEGLWVEEPNARGAITTSSAYPVTGGPPAAVVLGNDVLVSMASNRVRGTHDVFRLAANDLSFSTGPVPVSGPTGQWDVCNTLQGPLSSKQAHGAGLVKSDSLAVAFGNTAWMSGAQAGCCSNSTDTRTDRLFVTLLDAGIGSPTPGALFTSAYSSATVQGNVCISFNTPFDALNTRGSMAWSAQLNAFVATWWQNGVLPYNTVRQDDAVRLMFATVSPTGQVSTPRNVWEVPGTEARYQWSSGTDFNDAKVAVSPTKVLFAWANEAVQPFGTRFIRFALYDSALTSVVTGPVSFGFPYSTVGHHRVEWAGYDGRNFQLLVYANAQVNGAPLPMQLVTVSEAGVVLSMRSVARSEHPQDTQVMRAGTERQALLMGAQQQALVTAVASQSLLKFSYGLTAPDAGAFSTVDVSLGVPEEQRTDFALVPLSPTRVGVVWSDGNLKRTIMKCGP